ncbi:MAG: PLDc N-terminal domain-containing protein [Cryobacterium sp.]|nr:PLDc N-terminal domain-containing protein [Cryobacterium sp.]MBX3116610.1 PLDc N-terminal domain-containing protein [Cryobacterium sp.]MCO5294520.1 PLDc N-terminal domain-containing protein [Homoserinimonas sp.]MCW5944809.1 PLDc N-terminal domain-containing protein [Cryobacterium sp.]
MPMILTALTLLLMIGALVDIITKDDSAVKHLPKIFWIILVIIIPLAGSIIWFIVGHDYGNSRIAPPAPRVQKAQSPTPVVRDTEAELAALEREIEESEKAERIRKLELELQDRKKRKGQKP